LVVHNASHVAWNPAAFRPTSEFPGYFFGSRFVGAVAKARPSLPERSAPRSPPIPWIPPVKATTFHTAVSHDCIITSRSCGDAAASLVSRGGEYTRAFCRISNTKGLRKLNLMIDSEGWVLVGQTPGRERHDAPLKKEKAGARLAHCKRSFLQE